MVAIAAFLIILVILFDVEGVRSFVFGTFGLVAWFFVAIIAIYIIGKIIDIIVADAKNAPKVREEERKAKEAEKAEWNKHLEELKAKDPKKYKKTVRSNNTLTFFFIFMLSMGVLAAGLSLMLLIPRS